MKKTLALLLSVLMVISTITCMFTVTTAQAEAISGELIQNGDFENVTLNPVGTNMGGVMGTKIANINTLLGGKWYRATSGLSYATYGDLTDYNAETDEVTPATATDYAKYFTACSTVVAQPDDATNHIGRMNQTMLQGINFNADKETFTYKMKVKGNDTTTKFTIGFSGLQTKDATSVTDAFYSKYNLEVIEKAGNFTYTYTQNKIYITLTNPNEWTDVEIIFKATKIADATPSKDCSIIDLDFTMFHLYHDSSNLSSGDNGKNYRKNGMYVDDVSLKVYANPFGEGEFYKDGEKLENTNEYGAAKCTVNGEEVLGVGLGDTVVATPDYNEDANVFVGWYKGDELVTREKEITFTVNATDVYTPKFINKNLLNGASFENYSKDTSFVVADNTKYPNMEEWGASKNAGYYGATYAETIYDKNGNAYMQVATGSAEATNKNIAIVDDTYVRSGNYSLKIGCNYRTGVMGLDVKPNTNYTLSYYVTGTDTDAEIYFKTGIVSTVNISRSATPTAAENNTNPLNGMAVQTVADLNSAFTLVNPGAKTLTAGKWEKITLIFNSGNFEKLYLAVSPKTAESFWIDDLALVAEEEESDNNVAVKYVDTDGAFLENTANLNAEVNAVEDFDGSNLLTVDYEKESGAYTFIGWYDAENNLLSKEEAYDYEGNLANVYAKILSKNILDGSASFEGYENNTSLIVADNTKYPEVGEWGANKNAGYYGATYEEIIYDKYGNGYYQVASGSPEATSNTTTMVTNSVAYRGNNSLYIKPNSRTASTGLDVVPNTNYTLTCYVLAKGTSGIIKYMGVATTLNMKQGYTVQPVVEGNSLYCDALGNLPAGICLDREANITYDGTSWQKLTFTFNSGNFEKLYFVIAPSAGSEECWVDELSLVAEEKADTVDVKVVDENGDAVAEDVAANAAVEAIVEKDIYTGTKTATVKCDTGAYTFLGWYNAEDALFSAEKEFIVTGSLEGVYAKVQNNNLLTYAASYETYENNASLKYTGTDYPSGIYFGGNKNDGYLGQTFEETIYDNKGNAIQQTAGGSYSANTVNAVVTNLYAHSGNKSIKLTNSYWTASMGIEVKPNTDYALSYYMLAPKREAGVTNTIALSAISTTVNTGAKGTGSVAALNQATSLYLDSKALDVVHDGENWVKVTHTFNSMNLSKVYLVIGQTSDTKAAASWAYIDDMTMIETIPTTMDISMKNCASVDPVDASLDALYIGQEFTFKVIDNMETEASVIFNGEAVTTNADGSYTVILAEENALSVRFAGDEALPEHDEDEFGRKLNENNLDVYSEAVWEGDTVYHETALFTPDKDTVKLLYPVDEIVSLRSYDLMTNYIEGYDFEITEDGMIKRLEGGRIPVWANSLVSDTDTDWDRTDGKYVVLTGDQTYPKYAISVTYKHSTTFADGYTPAKPESQYTDLNNVISKLENGEEVNIVVYGDSISCGWSSSGMNPDIKIYDETNTEGNYITRYNINVAPYAPTWIQMLEAKLKEMYPDATINFKNLSRRQNRFLGRRKNCRASCSLEG